jgi:hypothetical protein
MKDGCWLPNGESIIIGSGGEILDGQHRLLAVIESGKTIRTMIVYGGSPEHFHTYDSGRTRSASDALHMLGKKQTGLLAAAARVVLHWEHDQLSEGLAGNGPRLIASGMILEVLARHPGIENSTSFGNAAGGSKVCRPSLITAAHYLAARDNKSKADEFFEQVVGGQHIGDGDPSFALRRRLIQLYGGSANGRSVWETWALIVKSWNYFTAGKRRVELRIREGELLPTMRLVKPWAG